MSMDVEASQFETSEMLASFLASATLLSESWRLCSRASDETPGSFLTEQIGSVGYVAFSGNPSTQAHGSPPSCGGLVPLEGCDGGLFQYLHTNNEGEEKAMVHDGMLQLFLSIFQSSNLQSKTWELKNSCKSIVITGHSIGGTTASLYTLWLLSHSQSISTPVTLLCITFGSPLLCNETLSRAILQERWGGNFCHVVSEQDIMPRLLFAPIEPITAKLKNLLHYWQLSMSSRHFGSLAFQLSDREKAELQVFVMTSLNAATREKAYIESAASEFHPFGSFLFVSGEGAVCLEDAKTVTKMLYLMSSTSSPNAIVSDHLKYADYVNSLSLQFMKCRCSSEEYISESCYEAGVQLALQSSGIARNQLSGLIDAKECLSMARRIGYTPTLNAAHQAISLSKITPYRAEIECYKACCDDSDDQMGYYDTFKNICYSKREGRVNMNRHKLATFWNNIIDMWDNNQLPYDFNRRDKWVNTSQFYKLLVEPLDIADYYRTGTHLGKGHYMKKGRERRYRIFDQWWRNRRVNKEENNKRNKFANLTQDSLFWAKLEEARDLLNNIRRETDMSKMPKMWSDIELFERYAKNLVEIKEVSKDVIARNSSYSMWVEELRELKILIQLDLPHHFAHFLDGKTIP